MVKMYQHIELVYRNGKLIHRNGAEVDTTRRRVLHFLRDVATPKVAMPRPKGASPIGNKDYLPSNDGQFFEGAKNLYAYALAHFSGRNVPSPRMTLESNYPDIEKKIHKIIDGKTYGDPMRVLSYTTERLRKIQTELEKYRIVVGHITIGKILDAMVSIMSTKRLALLM